jgi:hypothetical protein
MKCVGSHVWILLVLSIGAGAWAEPPPAEPAQKVSVEGQRSLKIPVEFEVFRLLVPAGNITIEGVEGLKVVEVKAQIRAEADSAELAQQLLQRAQFDPEINPRSCTLSVRYGNIEYGQRATSDLVIRVPNNLNLDVQSYVGSIEVTGVDANCELSADHGFVRANTSGDRLVITTQAGEIDATTAALSVKIQAEGNLVRVHLTGDRPPQADIQTLAGDVEIFVADDVSARMHCSTPGKITIDLPWEKEPSGKYVALGRLGAGEGRLGVTSQKGNISIRRLLGEE